VEFEDQPAIVVERFDRRTDPSGRVVRVHQEDMCQAFALDPSKKYTSDGGPGVAQIAQLLDAVGEGSARRFGHAVIANYLLGAPDAHAKNYSVLLAGRAAQLAPVYDVASGLVLSSTGRLQFPRAAMSIGGEDHFGEVEAKHWSTFARVCRLDDEDVRTLVRGTADALPDAVSDAIASVPSHAQGLHIVRDQVLPRVSALCQATKAGLDGTRRIGGRVVRPLITELEAIGTPASPADASRAPGPNPADTTAGDRRSTGARSEPEVFLDADE
jgi:serine/threonine-protein kinase HipA